MTALWLVLSLGVMLAAGCCLVMALWPRDEPLALDLVLGLGWILGGLGVAGTMLVFAATGLRGVALLAAVSLLSVAGTAAMAGGQVRRRWRCRRRPPIPDVVGAALVLLTAGWLTSVTFQAHLGYDGTVVWQHKARLIVEAGGAAPIEAMAQPTRVWAAPDYPLGVPSISAWVHLWTGVDDERLAKATPAAWAIATLLLVNAGVRAASGHPLIAALAVLVFATTPRLVVGEGSLTTGYADAPYGAAYLGAVLVTIRADWGRDERWWPLMIAATTVLPWIKQEGLVGAAILAGVVSWQTGRVSRLAPMFGPALAVHVLWAWQLARAGARLTQALAWPSLVVASQRLPTIAGAYVAAAADSGWGLTWIAMGVCLVFTPKGSRGPAFLVLGLPVLAGGATFTLSTLPSLEEHLAVTAPRQLVQIAPLALALISGAAAKVRWREQKGIKSADKKLPAAASLSAE